MSDPLPFEELLTHNSDLDGSPCELEEWSQADLMALISMAEAALTKRHALPACTHEHGSGILDTNGDGEFTCHLCGHTQKMGRGLQLQPG